MLWTFSRLAWAVCLVLPLLSLAHDHQGKRHHVHRQDDLAPRGQISCSGSRFTYFADGLGACGQVSQPGDFIVAVDVTQFTQELCFQPITITINGVTQTATIMDSCPGCPPCGLDFSSGLFQAFGPLSLGVMTGDWSLGSGGSSPPSSSAAPPPPPTTSVETPTTSLLPSPTSTSQPSATTTSSTISSTTTSASNSSMVPTQTSTSIIAVPSGVIPGETTGSSVLLDLESYLLLFAGILESCSSSQ